ncbi:cytochrome C oxidase assembly protein [alpha proteobacterium AAP81b]|nr:cytochrome C oxidase assembly protein [alpha proteobacterium AAP81b]
MSDLAARRRTGVLAALLAVAMIGLAYAAVPLYRMFCETTGFGGTTGRALALPDAGALRGAAGRTIKIRFDSNTAAGIAWRFQPKVNDVAVKIGEKNLAFFTATNLAATPTSGQAGFNVSPDVAGAYFKKIECFCFTLQTLKPGETVQMPVTFFVDPAILKDPIASKIDEITLSYTFYPVDNPPAEAVSAAATQQPNRG